MKVKFCEGWYNKMSELMQNKGGRRGQLTQLKYRMFKWAEGL